MRIRKIGYLFLWIAACLSGCNINSDIKDGLPYDEYIKIAQQHISKGDNEKAISAYNKALKIKPSDAETHYALGRLYYTEGQQSYKNAFNKYQLDILTNTNKKRNIDQTKDLETFGFKSQYNRLAMQEYSEVIKLSPENWDARYSIATDHMNNKRYKEAIAEYIQVIKYNPKYSSAYNQLGEAYLEVGACNLAIDNFTKGYKLDFDANSYFCDVGRVYIKMNNAEKATEMINRLKGVAHYYERLTGYQFKPHGKCLD